MGEMADYYYDLAMQEDIKREFYHDEHMDNLFDLYQKSEFYWITKTGDKILIQNLGMRHINAIINMFKKVDYSNHPAIIEIIRIIEIERNKRLAIS